MNQSPDPTRSAMRFFALSSVYCLVFAHLVAHGTSRAGMMGAFVAYAFAVLHLAILRWSEPHEARTDTADTAETPPQRCACGATCTHGQVAR